MVLLHTDAKNSVTLTIHCIAAFYA